MDPRCPEIKASRRYVGHAKYFINMLDKSLQMLGPDAELLEEIMHDLGKKHFALGVKTDFFEVMGESLMETLRELLGEQEFHSCEECWRSVFKAMSTTMIQSMKKEEKQ